VTPILYLFMAIGCGGDPPEPTAAELVQQAEPIYEGLASMSAQVPADRSGVTVRRCDPPPSWMSTISHNRIRSMLGEKVELSDAESRLSGLADQLRMARLPMRGATTLSRRGDVTEALEYWPKRSHIAVVVFDSAVLPRLTGDATFKPGETTGWVFAFDRATATLACAEPFSAANNKEVQYDTTLQAGADRTEADQLYGVKKDFEEHFHFLQRTRTTSPPRPFGWGDSRGRRTPCPPARFDVSSAAHPRTPLTTAWSSSATTAARSSPSPRSVSSTPPKR
jgi:hypothetical protein